MAITNVILPKLGESIVEATVLKILKQVGETVHQDETLMEIATDKVDSEVPSTVEGIVEEILCNEGDIVKIGTVIIKIRTSTVEPKQDHIHPPAEPKIHENGINKFPKPEPIDTNIPFMPPSNLVNKTEGTRFYSPLVMNIASREGVSSSELANIKGSGSDGRVTKSDILQFISNRNAANAPLVQSQKNKGASGIPDQQKYNNTSDVEVIEMDRMRRLIADHMTKSLSTSAHVTSFAEADVTNIVSWRDAHKVDFEKREGEKITFTPLFIEAIVKCIKKYPLLNSSVGGNQIHVKRDINLGMATALPNGNLIVPVIHQADQYNIIGLTKQVNRLATLARNGLLQPNDTQNGTFTFTNIGSFGSLMGTPIINQPQVAILAIGAIKKKPVVVESDQGDCIGIRHMMFVSMSYDHRIIDGALGSMFLNEFVQTLETFNPNREI